MKLKSFNFLVGLLIIFSFSPLASEEKIDIWKNKKETPTENSEIEKKDNQENSNPGSSQTLKALEK